MQLSLPTHEHERVAAQAVHHGLGDVDHRGHGDCRVRGVAAVFQHLQADLSGERLAGGDHTVGRTRSGAARIERLHGDVPRCGL